MTGVLLHVMKSRAGAPAYLLSQCPAPPRPPPPQQAREADCFCARPATAAMSKLIRPQWPPPRSRHGLQLRRPSGRPPAELIIGAGDYPMNDGA